MATADPAYDAAYDAAEEDVDGIQAIRPDRSARIHPDAPNRRDSSRRRLTAALDNSLHNLGTDHVDVYLVHWPDINTPFEETMPSTTSSVKARRAISACRISAWRSWKPA